MRIIAVKTLRLYWEQHEETEGRLKAWVDITRLASWANVTELLASIPNARSVGNCRVIFPMLHNRFRLIVAFRFDTQIAYIRFVGTHAEYDKIDATKI